MSSHLREEDDYLTKVNYIPLLNLVIKELQQSNPFAFSSDSNRLKIDVDSIAYNIAISPKISLPATLQKDDRTVSINFSEECEQTFPDKLRLIRDKLQELLIQKSPENTKLLDLFKKFLTPLTDWKKSENQGFYYPFSNVTGIDKNRLILENEEKKPPSQSKLKLHKLTIKVSNIKNFEQELKEGLKRNFEINFSDLDDDTYCDLEDSLNRFINYEPYRKNNEKSQIEKLIDLIKNETVARLKREAKIKYLEYISENIDSKKHPEVIYLQDLIRRLRLLEEYLNDETKSDSDYEVNYEGETVNYREFFARGESYDSLPIIPIVEGYLGEDSNPIEGEKTFTFALKLKLNGSVKNQGEKGETTSSFQYQLNFLNPDSKQHENFIKEGETHKGIRKILTWALLYTFIFASRQKVKSDNYQIDEELTYNPREFWEGKVEKILRGSDDDKKKEIFKTIFKGINTINAEIKVKKLEALLKTFLEYSSLIAPKSYSLQIGVRQEILEDREEKINRDLNFFKEEIHPKKSLKYLGIGKANVNDDYLCHLPVKFYIEDIRYYTTDDRQTLDCEYDIDNINALPIIFLPLTDNKARKLYEDSFKQDKLILLTYNHQRLSHIGIQETSSIPNDKIIFKYPDSPKAFVYRFAFSLLTYLAMEVILEYIEEKIFIPIMRLHIKDSELPYNEEHFFRNYSKILAHFLRQKHLVNSQGFQIKKNDKGETWRRKNSLNSLYSLLPKKFTITNSSFPYQPQLDKLALIIISSREADGHKKGGKRIANLYGEVVTIVNDNQGVIVRNDNTFFGNDEKEMMYENPLTLIKEIDRLYKEGFRHFLYIAKSPYSSNLNVTHDEKDLYFMSKTVLKNLKGNREDIRIYPIFFDKYFVVRLGSDKNTATSLYIQDTAELSQLFNDESQKSVVFFNLFNGKIVGNKDKSNSEKNYRGVMSYSTLLNTYQEILDNQDIMKALIDDKEENSLKDDILHYLTLFHFSRYEKHETQGKNFIFKLNPYENIIGDSSIGKKSLWQFNQKTEFNSLAFLTEVKRALIH